MDSLPLRVNQKKFDFDVNLSKSASLTNESPSILKLRFVSGPLPHTAGDFFISQRIRSAEMR